MTEDDIIAFAAGLPGVSVQTASEATGAPEIAWGDSFLFHDAEGVPEDRRFPFATIVTKDYTGFDEASRLDREGVFRLNVSVGRERFTELIGYRPAEHDDRGVDLDYTVLDTVIPHPIYGRQGWVSILNPGDRTADLARGLISDARDRVAAKKR